MQLSAKVTGYWITVASGYSAPVTGLFPDVANTCERPCPVFRHRRDDNPIETSFSSERLLK